jgi:hypothetical protein
VDHKPRDGSMIGKVITVEAREELELDTTWESLMR